jgi:hypothetical protein
MGDITTASGAKIYIGPAVASTVDTLSEFTALSGWTEVGLVNNLGEYGDESSSVKFSVLNEGRTRKAKGTRDAGSMTLRVGRDTNDVGQAALVAAEATSNKFAFKIVYPDRLTPTGTDSMDYFRALVMSKKNGGGTSDDVLTKTFMLDIDSEIFEVAAA